MKVYEIPNNVKNGVYLLMKDNEVVYVGQTKSGLLRIMQHQNKDFNKYSFIETNLEDLDYFEDLYIMKYQPKYNRFYSYYRTSIKSCYNLLKNNVKREINLYQLIEYIKKQGIEIKKFKGIDTITKKESEYINNKINERYR